MIATIPYINIFFAVLFFIENKIVLFVIKLVLIGNKIVYL